MKKTAIFIYIMGLTALSSFAQENTVTIDAELGDRNEYFATCWSMGAVTVSDNESTLISGSYSLRTNQVTNESNTATWIKSPWLKLEAGQITFKTRLDGAAGGNRSILMQVVSFDPENESTGEGDIAEIGSFEFPNPINKQTEIHEVSVTVPQSYIGQTVRVFISFVGSGGSARVGMDELVIPGEYASDPSEGCLPLAEKNDTDGDGIADEEESYPEDPYKAYNNYLPATGFGTLMFEDLWPSRGDYDFNDLVVDYRMNRITDAKGEVVEVVIELLTRAAGAGYSNGFGIEFSGLSPEKVIQVKGHKTTSSSIHTFMENGLEAGNEFATIIPFDDVDLVLTHPGQGALGINTDPKFGFVDLKPQTIVLTLKEGGEPTAAGPTRLSDLTLENFNPFLIVDQTRGVEVHLPGKKPTKHADASIFGTKEDGSTAGAESYYRNKENGLPWGLNVPVSIPYLVNKVPITKGYTRFFDWVISGGESYTDWYLDNSGYRNVEVMLNANVEGNDIPVPTRPRARVPR
ncbi:LruC domain-containing protein [Cyclobacterium lianum]|uniref:LruC domain-containing protein n=1 Tax=Cyclobacterium lianum TaxID=388280 RepID=A0A1M7IEQ1_9BACT|nr:LruC domain-containing protein [Cyclobacterium lianum]SHM39306.1 LruC domain-containing protein [Cyclobacterium lianum]